MTAHLKLRIHVSEPWDFERIAGTAELTGWTTDHADPDSDEWEVHLDHGFDYHGEHVGRLLAGPRYVGERLDRVIDAVVGFPARLAHRQDGGWHFALIGMVSLNHERDEQETGTTI